jgi:phosphohistidine phosphatase
MGGDGGKTLYLLRHAKAQKAEPGQEDQARSLIRRGRDAAERLSGWFASRNPLPTTVLCSPAARTRQTLELLLPALGQPVIDYNPRLYGASTETLLDAVARLPRDASAALIVGHNPGIEELALTLAGHAPARLMAKMREKFPTCALTVLTAKVRDWEKFADSSRAEEFIRPIDLG